MKREYFEELCEVIEGTYVDYNFNECVETLLMLAEESDNYYIVDSIIRNDEVGEWLYSRMDGSCNN